MPAVPEDVLASLAATDELLVACDFDGTLAPIVGDPAAARALPEASAALARLGTVPATTVAVISGRALADLATVSKLDSTVLQVGSHGTEFDDGSGPALSEAEQTLLAELRDSLASLTEGAAGVSVENKPAGSAVHVRRADPEVGATVLAAVRAGPASWQGVMVTEGKAVIDLAVVHMDKGAALDALRERTGASAVLFVGDDVTDERAFARLRAADVGVKVGPGDSLARYRVADPEAVAELLAEVATLRERHMAGSA